MRGNNRLVLNQATMTDALQYYFEQVLYAPGKSPIVKSINQDKTTSCFDVCVESKAENETAKSGSSK